MKVCALLLPKIRHSNGEDAERIIVTLTKEMRLAKAFEDKKVMVQVETKKRKS